MSRWTALFVAILAVSTARAEDVTWSASVPLWKSLSASGQLIDAGPAPDWASPPPAARLGVPTGLYRPPPIGTLRPQALPVDMIELSERESVRTSREQIIPAARLDRPQPLR